jgi:DNA-binding NarL/FixJ family response regulator
MIRIVLVDDQMLVRSGIAGLLALTDDIRVVAEADSAQAGADAVRAEQPDLLLLDVRMPGGSGISLIQQLQESAELPPTILLTTFDDDEALIKGLRAGARGFLLKDISLEALAAEIRRVVNGGTAFRTGVTASVAEALHAAPGDFDSLALYDPLTVREQEILGLMASGLSNREIAQALGSSEGTVKNQVSSILSKLGVRDRVRAVLRGIALGLV